MRHFIDDRIDESDIVFCTPGTSTATCIESCGIDDDTRKILCIASFESHIVLNLCITICSSMNSDNEHFRCGTFSDTAEEVRTVFSDYSESIIFFQSPWILTSYTLIVQRFFFMCKLLQSQYEFGSFSSREGTREAVSCMRKDIICLSEISVCRIPRISIFGCESVESKTHRECFE